MSSSTVESDIMRNLHKVLMQMKDATLNRSKALPQIEPRLVCVSKTKPTSLIIQAYEAGQRHFGENYVNELEEKSNASDILEKCKEIQWHFIGHLQSNKVKKVLSCPGLYMIETIHSKKIADIVNKQWPNYSKDSNPLNVMVQINTSDEDAKNGIEPDEAAELAKYIKDNCSNLLLKGLMTIGQFGYDYTIAPNPDFLCLFKCRENVCAKLNLKIEDLELSMGMSSDFTHAIELGSTNVRVGYNIFGSR